MTEQFSFNYNKIEIDYGSQATSSNNAGLRSDGELVQAVSSGPSTAGSGKANMDGLTILKKADMAADTFEFNASTASEGDDHTPIPILQCPSNPPRDGAEEHYYTITLEDATIDNTPPDPVDSFLF